jgi:coproporphyrinogen III oxidase
MEPSRETIEKRFREIQDSICKGLEELDGKAKFNEDNWTRPEGGGGRSRVISHADLLEKGGVNFSAVEGECPDFLKKEIGSDAKTFFATGVSIVLHPHSPMVPIIHMNIRYFETDNGIYWFGGGIDLTPHYVIEELAKKFHLQLKNTCDKFDSEYYPEFKKWADNYFFIPHRNETRGIGGIFFDKLKENEKHSKSEIFEFVAGVGETFVKAYAEQAAATRKMAYNEKNKQWQMLRRGRYVEFNLVYDRGTKFGLQTNGRIESILMSLPENASWIYNFLPEKGSEEEKTLSLLKKGNDWINH